MEIIGTGFLARHFAPLRHAHPNTLLFASGVSRSQCTDDAEFRREAELLYTHLQHCRDHNATLVYFSTSSDHMYGGPQCRGREDEAVFPRSGYGRHKMAMEHVIARSGAPYLILRLAYPLGPDQPSHQLIPALLQQVQQGKASVRRGVRRDLIDIADVLALTDTLLSRGVRNQTINMASGFAVLVEDVVQFLAQRVAHPVAIEYSDGQSEYCVSSERLAQSVDNFASFGFGPHYYQGVVEKYWPLALER